jgi:outer membrane protein TolC
MQTNYRSPAGTLALLFFALALTEPAARAERRLTLAEATALALANNPELRLEEAKLAEAEARRKGTRGLYGPKLLADANIMLWDSALKFKFDMPDMSTVDPVVLRKYSDLLAILPSFFDMGNIRDQVTAQIQLSLAQPITPLLQIHQGYKATRDLEESAALDQASKRAEVVYRAKEAYLRLMQVQRLTEVAKTGVEQVESHLKRALQFQSAGLIGRQEVLKAQVELSRARERHIKARYGASLASSALALQLGLSLDEEIVPTEKVADPPPSLDKGLPEYTRQAEAQRAELRSMQKKQGAAIADRRRSQWDMIPQVSAVATYQHTRGQGTFMPENAFFAGGFLKWEIWDWGVKHFAVKAAEARVRQAQVGERMLRDGINLQTKKAFLDLQEADEALIVARAAIKEAEESFRIEQRRFEANANTSTEVLDAQLALIRANLSYTSALYNHYMGQAALERAIGEGGS